MLSTSDAQPFFNGESYSISTGSESVDAWADIVSNAFAEMNQFSPDSNFIMLHVIAREIFTHQQQKVHKVKQNSAVSVSHIQLQDCLPMILFRMCGAAVARMLNVRKGSSIHE